MKQNVLNVFGKAFIIRPEMSDLWLEKESKDVINIYESNLARPLGNEASMISPFNTSHQCGKTADQVINEFDRLMVLDNRRYIILDPFIWQYYHFKGPRGFVFTKDPQEACRYADQRSVLHDMKLIMPTIGREKRHSTDKLIKPVIIECTNLVTDVLHK